MKIKKNGYTLVELLLVMLFMGTVFVMSVNFSIRNKDRWALRDTTREITTTYFQGKQRATRENSTVRISVTAKGYAYYWNDAGDWVALHSETFSKKIIATSTADFLINPSGFIIDPDSFKIAGAQTITLSTPRGDNFDTMTITIYPYGGLRVEKEFN